MSLLYYILFTAQQEEILLYQNFDLENIVTPVNVQKFEELLVESQYDKTETEFLIDGFKNGFSIEYHGSTQVKITSPNLKFRNIGSPTILWNKVMKEVKANRYAGPFERIPFDSYIQSPIGLVPKDGGKDTRLIFHLSYPRGRGISVNENTPVDLYKVKYPDFNNAIQLCLREEQGCHVAKLDMKSAF